MTQGLFDLLDQITERLAAQPRQFERIQVDLPRTTCKPNAADERVEHALQQRVDRSPQSFLGEKRDAGQMLDCHVEASESHPGTAIRRQGHPICLFRNPGDHGSQFVSNFIHGALHAWIWFA